MQVVSRQRVCDAAGGHGAGRGAVQVQGGAMTAQELFQLVASRYADKPDDFALTIGHFGMPDPKQPLGIYNLPEFYGYVAIKMSEVRAWANGVSST